MALGIVLKNHTGLIVAADHTATDTPSATSHFITLHNHTVVVISGNRTAVEKVLFEEALSKITERHSAAAVAQYVHAALQLKVVPNLAGLSGQVEILIAGIDPVRHTTAPDAYYLDSRQSFNLVISDRAATMSGASAVAAEILGTTDVINQSLPVLKQLAIECFTATRLRWPTVVAPRLKLAVVEPKSMQVYDL